MPLYFFNVFGSEDIFDKTGTELPNNIEARQRMIFIAFQIIEKFKVNPSDSWQMEALDEGGKIIGTMDFGIEDKRRSEARQHPRS